MREWQPGAHHEENMRKRERCRQIVESYKQGRSCVDCGDTHTEFLRFCHRDPTVKAATICDLVSHGRIFRLKEELPKCDLRCKRCMKLWCSRQDIALNDTAAAWPGNRHR